jgi:PIN domain nuclease of toxin-antitoxin system
MSLLLDTHVILWFLANSPKLSDAARSVILDTLNTRWVSPISLLEIALKNRIGQLPLPEAFGLMFPSSMTAADIHLLPIESQHINPLTFMPLHHKDPFDRLIGATALVEGLTLVSADSAFDAYGVARLW